MKLTQAQIAAAATCLPGIDARAAKSCAWLQACGYPGIRLLIEAAEDVERSIELLPDALGLDLKNVSCVFIGPAVATATKQAGRYFLRNVRHGLYLVPLSIESGMAIGCPIDLNFGFGGDRRTDPYTEVLQAAEANGIEVDDDLWSGFLQMGSAS